jgi:membrane protein required for colicin V production
MNYIDIIIGVLLFLAAINGFRRGFISEVASLAALIFGIWGAIEFSYITSDFLVEKFHLETEYLNIISFIVTFAVIVILIHIIGSSLTKFMEIAMMGFINKMAGLLFGFLRSALIISILLLVLNHIDNEIKILPEKAKRESQLYEPVKNFAPSLLPFVQSWISNGTFKQGPGNAIKKIKDTIET